MDIVQELISPFDRGIPKKLPTRLHTVFSFNILDCFRTFSNVIEIKKFVNFSLNVFISTKYLIYRNKLKHDLKYLNITNIFLNKYKSKVIASKFKLSVNEHNLYSISILASVR